MSIKSFLLHIYDKAFQVKDALCDFLTRKEAVVSIGDLMSYRGFEDGIQLLVASRLMDVESYLFNHDNSFQYQKIMSTCGRNDDLYYDDNKASQIFENLISSYMEKGYNGKSHFLLDKDYLLRNGTHRAALHIYLKDYTAKAYVLKRKFSDYDNIYTHFENALPKDVFDLIKVRLNNIREELIENGVSFCAIIPIGASLQGPASSISTSLYVKRELGLNKLPVELSDSLHLNTNIMYKLVLFTLNDPQYEVVSSLLESQKIKQLDLPNDIFVSKSIYEGKQVYDKIKPYFINTDVVN